MSPRQHENMLLINGGPLPNIGLTYLAFRVSFLETLERIVLSRQVHDGNEIYGFLTEVPFLRGVPPHVQLDLLADTWSRHHSRGRHDASLIDESVIYAVCETAAYIAESEPTAVTHSLITGPRLSEVPVDHFLAGELRNLHLRLANEGDFLLLSQFEDIPPDESSDLKREYRLDQERLDEMFNVLGRWSIAPRPPKRRSPATTAASSMPSRTTSRSC